MRNRFIGLGIFALIFSFNLLFSGTMEATQATVGSPFAQSGFEQEQTEINFSEIEFHDGILQNKTETNEVQHVVRKFPATIGLLFLLLNQQIEKSPAHLFAAHLCFSPSKDLPVTYHNLRI